VKHVVWDSEVQASYGIGSRTILVSGARNLRSVGPGHVLLVEEWLLRHEILIDQPLFQYLLLRGVRVHHLLLHGL
jgi:hypothetical protein